MFYFKTIFLKRSSRMKRFTFMCFILLSITLSSAQQAGTVIVKLSPDVVSGVDSRLKSLAASTDTTSILSIGLKSFDRVSQKYRAQTMKRVFPDAGKYEEKHRKYGLHLWYELSIPDSENPEVVAKEYQGNPYVQIAEPRYQIRRMDMPNSPSDSYYGDQWNYHNTGQFGGVAGADIRLPEAWSINTGSKKVIVSIVDGGVNYDHEDLKGNMWVNEAELNGVSGVDDDGNGYVDDIYGHNFVKNRGVDIGTIQKEAHATHVAGIVAAVTNNAKGVSGIAGGDGSSNGARLMVTQIMNDVTSAASIGPAMIYAADNGAVISQNSWGYEKPGKSNASDLVAINYFIEQAGRDENGDPRKGTPMAGGIVIFAAGNDSADNKWYPAYYDEVIAVAATDNRGQLASYSNFGSWVDISAPGGGGVYSQGILSTVYTAARPNSYAYMSGTSMACPHVSGVAALILSQYGSEAFTPDILRERLLQSVTSLSTFDPEHMSVMGSGLLNAAQALASGGTPDPVIDLSATMRNAVSVTLTWTVPNNTTSVPIYAYAVAYATEPITESNFSNYWQTTITTSNSPGQTQEYILSGLNPSTGYYIAIRSIARLGDQSAKSNNATATTRDNQAPQIVNPLSDATLRDVAPETAFSLAGVFSDPDGDAMVYKASSANTSVAEVRTDGDQLLIQPIAAGSTVVTVTADDENSGLASITLNVTITKNRPPTITGLLADTTLIPHRNIVNIILSNYISDPEGDQITYTYELSATGIVDITINNGLLTIDPQQHGFVTVTLIASDAYKAKSIAYIYVTVEQKYTPDDPGKLLVYPNPTSDILYYSFILPEKAPIYVRLVNSIGSLIYQTQETVLDSGVYYFNIDMSLWAGGMYVLQYVENGKIVDTKKVIKQ